MLKNKNDNRIGRKKMTENNSVGNCAGGYSMNAICIYAHECPGSQNAREFETKCSQRREGCPTVEETGAVERCSGSAMLNMLKLTTDLIQV